MAKEKGFYKDVGLDVTLKELNSHIDLVDSVISGKANYAISDSALIYSLLKKRPIMLMMPILEHSPLALLTTKNINSLEDFSAKNIFINKFSLKSPALLSMLYVSNFDIDKLQSKDDVYSAQDITKQNLDLYSVYTPNEPYYLKKHHIKYHLFSPSKYSLDFYGDILFTSENELDKHFERTIRFMDASKKGWRYALSHIDETIKVIQQKYNSQHYSAEELHYQADAYKKLISKSFTFNRQKLDTIRTIFQLFYKMRSTFDFDDFIVNPFIATKEERTFLKEHTIRCISTTNWAPFNLIKDDKVVGLGIDYWDIIADKLHIDKSCESVSSFSELLGEIKSKEADLTISTSATKEREKYAAFSKSYVSFPVVIATKKGVDYTPDISSIKDKTFALVKNHTATKMLLAKIPNLHYIETKNLEDALKLVESSKVYGTAEILPVLAYTINKKNFNNLEITGSTDLEFPVKFMIRKDYQELLPMINRVIDSIDKQTRKKIYDRWISVNMKNGYSKHQVNKFALIGGGVLILFALWVALLLLQIKKRKKAEKDLDRLANYDKLTSIYNRHKIDTFLTKQMEIAKRYKRPLSIIFFDIDKFKTINDTYGHKAGDKILQELTALISKYIRESDVFGRWGSEEFLVISPETDLQSSKVLAEKLRKNIEEYHFTEVENVTCSFGVIALSEVDTLDEAMTKVDKLLYIAKESGRNRVVSDVED